MHVARALVYLFAVVFGASALAKGVRYTTDKDGNPIVWQEAKVTLPAFPEDSNLAPFSAPVGGAQNRYFLDTASIVLGQDRVVRYTVVIISRSGTRNIIHEGLACDFREVKTYAYGNTRRAFTKFSNPTWNSLAHRGGKGYQGVLADRYLCDDSYGYLDRDGILQKLERAGGADDDTGVGGHDND